MPKKTKPLNIFSIGEYPPFPGGAAISGLQVCQELNKLGHKITVFTQEYNNEPMPKYAGIKFVPVKTKHVLDVDIKTVELVRWKRQFKGFGGRIAKIPFLNAIKKEMKLRKPDVIIVNYGVPYANFVMSFAKRNKIPVITVLRGSDVHVLPLKGYNKTKKTILRAYKKADAIITVSDYLRNILKEIGIKKAKTIRTSPDTKQFFPLKKTEIIKERKKLNIPLNATVFIHTSTLKPVKSPLLIVKAAEIALKKNPNMYFLVIGEGELGPEMRKMVNRKGLKSRFRFLGWCNQSQVRKYLGLSDALVMASKREGLPRAVLEAIAMAKPVISSRAGGIPEIVFHNKTGFLYKHGDINALANYMNSMTNKKTRERLSAETIRHAKKMSISELGKKYNDLVLKVVEKRKRKPSIIKRIFRFKTK